MIANVTHFNKNLILTLRVWVGMCKCEVHHVTCQKVTEGEQRHSHGLLVHEVSRS